MIDNYGNAVPTHDLDLEYVYPPKSERICAQDERFASVNEAIGTLQYNLEQHIEKCADGLAPLADFISSSWAVIDEYGARLEALEKAQRPHWLTPANVNEWIAQNNPPFAAAAHPPEGDWAHIPSAEWEAIVEELEGLRNQRAVMDADGVLLSHDAWDAMERELAELRAKWDAIPWSTLNHCELILTSYNRLIESVDTRNRADEMREWLDANMPKEAGEC